MGRPGSSLITREELQLAWRNRGLPLEALRYPVTPLGMHYVLVHYDVPFVDDGEWQLRVDGDVATPLELAIADLRTMSTVTRAVTLECAGNGRALLEPRPASVPWLLEAVGTGIWTGALLSAVLDAAGLGTDAVELVFTGADRGFEAGSEQPYQRSMTIADATTTEAVLAYELNGLPLPLQHGFPLRLLVPGWYGMASVKWLVSITAVTEPFVGYQNTQAYRLRRQPEEPGDALDRIMVRSLMVPPGIPEFFTRARIVRSGEHTLLGRAWSGHGPIRTVDVSVDGGRSWLDAEVDQPTLGPTAWQEWRARWQAEPGDYELCCRATDAEGNRQPLHAHETWNVGGYGNNAVHRIAVRVE